MKGIFILFLLLSLDASASQREYFVGRVESTYNKKEYVREKCEADSQLCEIVASTGCMAEAYVTFVESDDLNTNQVNSITDLQSKKFDYDLGKYCGQKFILNRTYFVSIERNKVEFSKHICKATDESDEVVATKVYIPYDREVQDFLTENGIGQKIDDLLMDLTKKKQRFTCGQSDLSWNVSKGLFDSEVAMGSIAQEEGELGDSEKWVWKKAINLVLLLTLLRNKHK